MNTFGIVDSTGAHVDVSNSLKGAKRYATNNGYNKVSVRYNSGYTARIVAVKLSTGKWVNEGD